MTHAVLELTQITAGDRVLVTGPGASVLMTMQVAKAHGAIVIVAGTAKDVQRLEVAQQLGADDVVNVQERNLLQEVATITSSLGVDIVLECSGNERAANDGLMAVKKG